MPRPARHALLVASGLLRVNLPRASAQAIVPLVVTHWLQRLQDLLRRTALLAHLANTLIQPAARSLPPALSATLVDLELKLERLHSAPDPVLLVGTRWQILLLAPLLKTALLATLDVTDKKLGLLPSARAPVLLVDIPWRIPLLQLLKTASRAQRASISHLQEAMKPQTA